jgi:hypothetical protein
MEQLLLTLHHMMTSTRDWHERRELGGLKVASIKKSLLESGEKIQFILSRSGDWSWETWLASCSFTCFSRSSNRVPPGDVVTGQQESVLILALGLRNQLQLTFMFYSSTPQ